MFKLAIFGGAFDPFHNGHLHVIRRALKEAERVTVVPSYAHPYAKQMAPFEQRSRWLVDSLDDWLLEEEHARVVVSDVEKHLARVSKAPVYSSDLLRQAQASTGIAPEKIALVVGQDIQPYLHTFRDIDTVKHFGCLIIEEPSASVHSGQIRDSLQAKSVLDPARYVSSLIINDITRYYQQESLDV